MVLLMLAGVIGVGWLWWTGRLGREGGRNLALFAGFAIAMVMIARGQWIGGLALGIAIAALGQGAYLKAKGATIPMDEMEARALLGLESSAGREEILAAHRRLITQVHPDKGGSAELARRVNAARDTLIASLLHRG